MISWLRFWNVTDWSTAESFKVCLKGLIFEVLNLNVTYTWFAVVIWMYENTCHLYFEIHGPARHCSSIQRLPHTHPTLCNTGHAGRSLNLYLLPESYLLKLLSTLKAPPSWKSRVFSSTRAAKGSPSSSTLLSKESECRCCLSLLAKRGHRY